MASVEFVPEPVTGLKTAIIEYVKPLEA